MEDVLAEENGESRRWRSAVDRTRAVPSRFKEFSLGTDDAYRVHGIDRESLDRLLQLGLPHEGAGADRRFDDQDLTNIALSLGLPTPVQRTQRWWSRSLRHHHDATAIRRMVQLSCRCPDEGHPGACRFELNPAMLDASVPGSCEEHAPGMYTFDVQLAPGTRFLGETHGEFVATMSALQFHFVPRPLHNDMGFVRETGLADCSMASRYGLSLATSMGFSARRRLGHFVAGHYLLGHSWVELRDDGDWVPTDPFWLTTLARWGIDGSEHWPAHRSPGPLLWGFRPEPNGSPGSLWVAKHNGEPIRVTLMSKLAEG